jgi:hypothetical protein
MEASGGSRPGANAGRLPGDYLLETAFSLAWICGFGTAPMS